MIEEIQVGEQKIPIEVKPLTLIFKSGDFVDEIKYPNRIPIGIQDAIYHIERVKKLHKDLFYYLAMAMPMLEKDLGKLSIDDMPQKINQMGTGIKHLAGRLDLSLKFIDMKVPFAWVHPEDGLHPSVQVQLGDIAIKFSRIMERKNG